MSELEQKALAQQTYDLLGRMLPDSLRGALAPAPGDPALGQQEATRNVVILRILPVSRRPVKFWSETTGYYEIGIGPYLPTGRFPDRCLGGIQFFQYPHQSRLGKGNHIPGITEILKALLTKEHRGFDLSTPEVDGMFHFEKRYPVGSDDASLFPCELAAADLCWLITATLPRFWAMAGGR